MEETVIPQLDEETISRIKKTVAYHYHFSPTDHDIEWIDALLRNHYITLHDQAIIRYLADNEISRSWLRHRDRMGSVAFSRFGIKRPYLQF